MTAPTDSCVKPAEAANKYYEFQHYSGRFHDWSMTHITGDSWLMKPVGAVSLLLSVVARVAEFAVMSIVNLALFVKNMLFCDCWENKPVDPVNVPVNPVIDPEPTDPEEPAEKPALKLPSNAAAGAAGAVAGGLGTWAALGMLPVAVAASPYLAVGGAATAAGIGAKYLADKFKGQPQTTQAPVLKTPAKKVKVDAQ